MAKKSRNNTPRQTPSSTPKIPQTPTQPAPDAAPASPPRLDILSIIKDYRAQRALQLVLLAAVYAPVSQLSLSPVYGAIPAAVYQRYALTISFLVGFALRGYLPKWIPKALPGLCFWIPTIQFVLFQYSSTFGNPLGPLITESLTTYPLIALSVYTAITYFDEINAVTPDSATGDALPAMGLFVFFHLLNRAGRQFVSSWVGPSFLKSRIGMQLTIATLYAIIVPAPLMWTCLPTVTFTMVANPHCTMPRTTEILNNTLNLHDFTLIDRKESVSGYISVLDDNTNGFRVMRADHSLLGGEWLLPPSAERLVAEPIYLIFTMLEAVRLVEPQSKAPDSEKRALNVGLGIGTAPSALVAHGINTTVLELDPVVHEFAGKYFNLPKNHSYLIGDAVAALENSAKSNYGVEGLTAASFDYIIHDVFTGGAEPVELFTAEFLAHLHALLKPDGVVAINYAGDVRSSATSIIYRTIASVFGTCRVFRESAVPQGGAYDFTNMVFFCRKRTESSEEGGAVVPITISFRKPVKADFLGSRSREEYLIPRHEIEPTAFERDGEVLRRGKTRVLEKLQVDSAVGHWRVMRTVLPDKVWELW